MDDQSVQQVVERVIRDRFPDGSIKTVKAALATDDEGDKIIQVTVVVGKKFGLAHQKRIVGLIRHIRSELGDAGDQAFPMVDFISSSDAAKMSREIA